MLEFKKSWMCLSVLLPAAAFGQFFNGTGTDGPNATKPWADFKLNAKTRIKLDFRDASVDNVLAMFEKASGITIVKDPTLTGKVTITSAKPVSLNDAFSILKANLDLKGFDLSKEGSFLEIKNRNSNNGGGGRGFTGFDPSAMTGGDDLNRIGVKVYTCAFANAAQLAKVVNDVYASTGTTNPFGGGNNPFGGNRGGNPFGGGNQGGNRFGGGGGFGQGGNNRGFAGMFGGGQTSSPVKASSDDYTNSVIVSANDRDQAQVGNLVHQLDRNSEEPIKPHIFHLKYASCNDVQPVLLNVLQTNAPKGKLGSGPQSLQGTFQQALRIGTGQAASGPVVSDTRTNSVVVTTSPANLEIASKLVDQLDTPVNFESTTFVYPLQNGRPDIIANLFLQAFGPRSGTNSSTSNRNTFAGSTASSNGTSTTGTNGAAGARAPGANIGTNADQSAQNSLPIQLQDPNATSGDLLTSVGVQGFGFGGGGGQRPGGGGGSTSSQAGPTVQQVRDSSGQITNMRDLTGQITVIPDMDNGSLIVVTTPDNRELVKSILQQLDTVAQQVMIQTVIVEASLTKANQFGLEWQYATTKKGVTTKGGTTFGLQNANPAETGFSYTLAGSDLTGFFNMLQTDTKFQILSTPRIFTSNNITSSINISQSIPYIVSTIQNTNGTTSFNYAFQNVGIILTVTPRITSNGYVNMDVTQTANDLQGYTTFNAPIVNQREANTTVTVKDGETVVLGGMIQNQVTANVNKVPLLGDIPVLGSLFQSKTNNTTKTELLVFLTPKVIRDPAEAKKMYNDTQKQMTKETKDSLNIIQPATSSSTAPKKTGGQ